MTQNQISFAKLSEDSRHNRATEKLTKAQNKLQKRNIDVTESHYERADAAAMTSANANAMNAVTNRRNYEMAYDIEYGWTGDSGYPRGMPLSAQKKNAELAIQIAQSYPDLEQKYANVDQTRAQTEKTKAETVVANKQADTLVTQALQNVLNPIFGRKGLVGVVESITTTPNQQRP